MSRSPAVEKARTHAGQAATKSSKETDSEDETEEEVNEKKGSKSALGLVPSDSDEDDRGDEGNETEKKQGMNRVVEPDSSDDEREVVDRDGGDDRAIGGNDFENMMQKKRQENKRYRKKKDIDVINDNDDAIAKMIADMRIAAKEDRELNSRGQPATKKMAMFKTVLVNLRKVELQMAFVEANLLSVMTDWLAPMPDKSLPHIFIRTEFLRLLEQMKIEDTSRLKESGIGKAVMYLYRHPKEERNNKNLAGHLIYEWARPIFHKETDFAKLTKAERREQDLDMAARLGKRKRRSAEPVEEQPLRPGDPGWVSRARVPMVDNVEFINRPTWQTTADISTVKKKSVTMLEKHKRAFADRKRAARNTSLFKISIEGARLKEF